MDGTILNEGVGPKTTAAARLVKEDAAFVTSGESQNTVITLLSHHLNGEMDQLPLGTSRAAPFCFGAFVTSLSYGTSISGLPSVISITVHEGEPTRRPDVTR